MQGEKKVFLNLCVINLLKNFKQRRMSSLFNKIKAVFEWILMSCSLSGFKLFKLEKLKKAK